MNFIVNFHFGPILVFVPLAIWRNKTKRFEELTNSSPPNRAEWKAKDQSISGIK